MESNQTNREDRILDILGGLSKAVAPDFFYTRLTGRMQKETEPEKKPFFLLRPAFIAIALAAVLILNVISLTRLNTEPVAKAGTESAKPATTESFAKAYGLESASLYE
jgi:hypothetical protein